MYMHMNVRPQKLIIYTVRSILWKSSQKHYSVYSFRSFTCSVACLLAGWLASWRWLGCSLVRHVDFFPFIHLFAMCISAKHLSEKLPSLQTESTIYVVFNYSEKFSLENGKNLSLGCSSTDVFFFVCLC